MKKSKTPNSNIPPDIAVLVDGENISPSALGGIMEFASRYGQVTVKRIYADWSKTAMSKWKEPAMEFSFRLIEAFSYIKGKNTADIVLVIEAVDLLNTAGIQGFCIASSDSDYTPLAQYIREKGCLVFGCGESKTPAVFINSCRKFLFLDKKEDAALDGQVKPRKGDTPDTILKKEAHLFDKAFEAAGKDEVTMSQLGMELKRISPKYKPRRYGCKTLGDIYRKLERYEVIQTGIKGIYNTVRLKEGHETEGHTTA